MAVQKNSWSCVKPRGAPHENQRNSSTTLHSSSQYYSTVLAPIGTSWHFHDTNMAPHETAWHLLKLRGSFMVSRENPRHLGTLYEAMDDFAGIHCS